MCLCVYTGRFSLELKTVNQQNMFFSFYILGAFLNINGFQKLKAVWFVFTVDPISGEQFTLSAILHNWMEKRWLFSEMEQLHPV